MGIGKNIVVALAAFSLASSPALAATHSAPVPVDTRASTQVDKAEDLRGGALWIMLLVLAAAVAAVVLADSPDSP